jgi:hypothetical protein
MRCIQRRGIRRFCAGGKVGWNASKAMAYCLESSQNPTFLFVTYRSTRATAYTDGLIEPENASGDCFGDRKLEQVVRNNQSRLPSELSDQLLSEIRLWQPASLAQQDDITLIVIDVA